jgi:hypothetical protein
MPGRLCKHRRGSYSQSLGRSRLLAAFFETTSGITFSTSFRGTEEIFISRFFSFLRLGLSSSANPIQPGVNSHQPDGDMTLMMES